MRAHTAHISRVASTSLGLFLVAACAVDLEAPADGRVECETDSDCPLGLRCNADNNRCYSTFTGQPRCGDGTIDPGEECDCGESVELLNPECIAINDDSVADRCRTNCELPKCGDGVIDSGAGLSTVVEECDDGNLTAGDNCSPACTREICGNGIVDPGEVCDDFNVLSGDDCSPNCLSDESCGNGYVDFDVGEQCDCGDGTGALPDGCATANDDELADACRTDCQRAHCGDGVQDDGEDCDDPRGNSDYPDFPCRTDCRLRRCGDEIIDTFAGEVCDDGDTLSGNGCSGDCRSDETCGNEVVDYLIAVPEGCDEGDDNSNDPDATCRSNCQPGRCGDGIHDPLSGEHCDGADVDPNGCLAMGFYGGTVSCDGDCRFNTDECVGTCGDGIVQAAHELCDSGPPVASTCITFGYDLGALTCHPTSCLPDVASCGRFGWTHVEKPDDQYIWDLWVSPNGQLHTISFREYRVFDGTSWTTYSMPGQARDLWAFSETDVWIASFGDSIFHFDGSGVTEVATVEDGATSIVGRSNTDIWGFVGARTGASPAPARLHHYDGSTWTTIPTTIPDEGAKMVWTAPGEDVYISTNSHFLRYNGSTFTPVGPTGGVRAMTVFPTGELVAVHQYGWVSIDDGNGWSTERVGLTTWRAVWGTSFSNFYIAGEGGNVRSYSNGQWLEHVAGTSEDFAQLWGQDASNIYAGGWQLKHFDGTFWNPTETPGHESYSNPGIQISGSAPDLAYAVWNTESDFARFDGVSWSTVSHSFGEGLQGLSALDPAHTWFAGTQTVWKYNGSIFTAHDLSGLIAGTTYTNIRGIWVSPAGHVYLAAGNQGQIFYYNGSVWSDVGPGWSFSESERFNDVWGASATEIFAVGSDGSAGQIAHSSGGSFTAMSLPATDELNALGGTSATDVFAVGDAGTILHYDGSWTVQPAPTEEDLHDVWALSPTDVFAVGEAGTVLHYNGSLWRLVRFPDTHDIGSVWADGVGRAHFVTRYGAVMTLNYPAPFAQ